MTEDEKLRTIMTYHPEFICFPLLEMCQQPKVGRIHERQDS